MQRDYPLYLSLSMITSRAFIPFILCTLALSLAAVALIVNGALRTPQAEEIAVLCGERFAAALQPADCPEPEAPAQEISTVAPSASHPGFSYPYGWNAIATTTPLLAGEERTDIRLTFGGLFFLCDTCTEGVIITLSQEPFVLDATQTLDTYISSLYTSVPGADIQKETFGGNKTKYTINGISPTDGPFTHIIAFGATSKAEVLLPASDLLPQGVAERAAFISSLDFSLLP